MTWYCKENQHPGPEGIQGGQATIKEQMEGEARNDFLPFRIAVGVAIVATILIVAGIQTEEEEEEEEESDGGGGVSRETSVHTGGAALSTRPWLAKSGAASSAYFSTGTVSAGVISLCAHCAAVQLRVCSKHWADFRGHCFRGDREISDGFLSSDSSLLQVSVGVFSVGIFSFGGLWAWGVYCAWIKVIPSSPSTEGYEVSTGWPGAGGLDDVDGEEAG
eukprot:761987-Hanusia_phi.AAC.5